MKVKCRLSNGNHAEVECCDRNCPGRECFSPGHFQHRSCNNVHDSGCDDHLSCMYRNYHGCPDTAFDKDVPYGKELETLQKRHTDEIEQTCLKIGISYPF